MAAKNKDLVREQTSDALNSEIDQETLYHLRLAANNPRLIDERLELLNDEWDMERALELNASTLAFTGVILGAFVNRKWLVLPAVVTFFLAQHAIQGWCPPLPILRRLGFRTRQEIDKEKFGLKTLRGDFKKSSTEGDAAWRAVNK
ncbi:hypothetical protein [Pseudocnuella soli]|uniref:hypothetical protein n=1 Tax=Pseudocnuella soli TaxID=2502779 RepID=UPI00104AD7F5|nr:hypothetical protein [Pseudocnuella soli]